METKAKSKYNEFINSEYTILQIYIIHRYCKCILEQQSKSRDN